VEHEEGVEHEDGVQHEEGVEHSSACCRQLGAGEGRGCGGGSTLPGLGTCPPSPLQGTATTTGGGGGGEEDDDDTLNMSLRRNVGNGDAFPKKWDKLGLILNPEGFQNPAFKQGMARVKNIYGKKQDPRVPAVCAAVCSGRAAKTMPSSLPAWKSDHYTKTQDVEYFL